MIPTQPSTDFRAFQAFWDECREGAALPHRGASESEIAEYVRMVGFPVPEFYVDYLREYGEEDRSLTLHGDGHTNVSKLIAFYKDQVSVGDWDVPPGGIVVALPLGLTGGRSLVYPFDDSTEAVAVVNWGWKVEYTLASSCVNWIYSTAFRRSAFEDTNEFPSRIRHRYETSIRYRWVDAFDELRTFATQLGFQSYWFSDGFRACLQMNDASGYMRRTADYTTIFLSSSSDATLSELTDAIKRRFPSTSGPLGEPGRHWRY